MSGYNQRKRVVLPMTTPTPEIAIVCPDCKHPILWDGKTWHDGEDMGCSQSGCNCELDQNQALAKWIEQDRAETRRAVLDELTTKAQAPSFNDVKRVIDENITGGYDHTKCAVEFETEDSAAEVIGLYTPVIMLLVRLQDEAKETRRAALLEACRKVCPSCDNGVKLEKSVVYFHVANFVTWECHASPIHALLAQERERAQGGGE